MNLPTLRRAGRAALVLGLLAALWVVPVASGADLDPTDPSAPGLADPMPFSKCEVSTANLPPGAELPAGLPDQELCSVGRDAVNGGPDFVGSAGYSGVTTLGLQGSPHLAQWIKVPLVRAAALIPTHSLTLALLPSQVPTNLGGIEIPDVSDIIYTYPGVYFLSADQRQAGEIPPFRVTTMAFGAVPVQVTIHIIQPRRSNGDVEPLSLRNASPTANFDISGSPVAKVVRDSQGTGRLIVRLSNLLVDGRPVDVGDRCQTRTPATLDLRGDGYQLLRGVIYPPTYVPPGKYNPLFGGLLRGSLDIPAFSRCGTDGEDLSPLLTNAVSGPDNPLTIVQAKATDNCFPLNRNGSVNPNPRQCALPEPLPVPTTDPSPQTPFPAPPYPIPTH